MRSRAAAAWVFGVLWCAGGCSNAGKPSPEAPKAGAATKKPAGTPVAQVGDAVITVEELEDKINAQGPFARPRFAENLGNLVSPLL